ncbi:hypothetical protein X777_01096 [Ooceraea biroi]|uniref:DUF659 domain-containing protein n=1 Tax=Ooceraea biroi TaxID=2015173 RepID=A0A026WS54_OOCBI|nr:hypothetical protein X777_01095 [Ooceraea biroi]EZA58501.1 hypothetical protein X777_01096 [Ooceraea biroi]
MHDSPQIKKRKAQNTITDFVIKTTSSQQTQIDQSIAEFFYAANLSFNAAQLKSFAKMIQSLRPDYKPPSSKMIDGQLFDITYEKNEIDLKEKLQSKSLILTVGGWSNVRNDLILAISLHTGTESFLFNTYDSGSEKKTAKRCSEVVEIAIKECEEKYDAKSFAVVTDNENKMSKMWQMEIALEQDNFDDSISNILNDMAIYSESVYLEKQLSIVTSALNILQRESTSISEAVDVWSNLLKEEVWKSYKSFFQKRFNQAITPVHLLAHMMDLKYNREHLSTEQEDIAEEWISNNCPEYLPGVMVFKIKDEDVFRRQCCKKM